MQANANVTFNTHKAVKALKSSGFDEEQAEAVVETIDKAVNETVATKADIKDMATKADLEVMAAKMAANMATKDDLKGLATKDELRALKQTVEDIQENIDKKMATKEDLKAEIASLETRMMRMMLIQTLVLVSSLGAIIAAFVKLL